MEGIDTYLFVWTKKETLYNCVFHIWNTNYKTNINKRGTTTTKNGKKTRVYGLVYVVSFENGIFSKLGENLNIQFLNPL